MRHIQVLFLGNEKGYDWVWVGFGLSKKTNLSSFKDFVDGFKTKHLTKNANTLPCGKIKYFSQCIVDCNITVRYVSC